MISFDKPFIIYDLGYSIKSTYRFLTKFRMSSIKNLNQFFNVSKIELKYISPLMPDLNNTNLLGAFLIMRLIGNQFPYISKFKRTSTLKMYSIAVSFLLH